MNLASDNFVQATPVYAAVSFLRQCPERLTTIVRHVSPTYELSMSGL